MSIFVNVVGQKMHVSSVLDCVVEGSQNFVKFIFNLSEEWDGLEVFAQFAQNGKAYNMYLDDDNSAYLPPEIVAGTCTLMLYGSSNITVGTTNYLTFKIGENILVSGDVSITDIPKSLYTQLIEQFDEKYIKSGDIGDVVKSILDGSAAGGAAEWTEEEKLCIRNLLGVIDEEGVRAIHNENSVLCTAQDLTDEQKARARTNIGAAEKSLAENVAIFRYQQSTFDEVKEAYDAGKFCVLLYKEYQLPLFSLSGTTFTFKTQDTGKQQNCWLQPSGWGHAENLLVTNARATQIEEDLSWTKARADEAWELANTADNVANNALYDASYALSQVSAANEDAAYAITTSVRALERAEEAVMVAEDTFSNIKVIRIPNAEKGGVGGTLVLQENTYYQFIGGAKKTLRLYNADGTTVGYEKQHQILNIYCGSVDDVDEFGAAREVKTVKTAYAAFVGMNTDISINDLFSDASKFFESGSLAMRKVGDDGTEYGNRCEVDYPANSTIIIQTRSPHLL